MCSVTKEAYAIVLVTDTFKIRQDTYSNSQPAVYKEGILKTRLFKHVRFDI